MNYNLPPGCSVNDLPGNSIKEVFVEEWLDEHFGDAEHLEVYLEDTHIDVSRLKPDTVLDVCQAAGPEYLEFLTDIAEDVYNERP